MKVMKERHDWNRLGPPIPRWFRLQLAKINPDLVLQYVPPQSIDPAGVSTVRFPQGIWQICKRLPRSRFLFKRVIYSLTDRDGNYHPPDHDLLRLLRTANYLWRRREYDVLEEIFDQGCDAVNKLDTTKSRHKLECVIDELCSLQGHRSFKNRVFLPKAACA